MLNKSFLKKTQTLSLLSLFLLSCKTASPYSRIEKERTKIDQIDKEVVDLLSERMKVAMNIGAIKKENKIEVTQPSRWNTVKDALRKRAIEKGVDPEMIVKMYEMFYQESVRKQEDLQKK